MKASRATAKKPVVKEKPSAKLAARNAAIKANTTAKKPAAKKEPVKKAPAKKVAAARKPVSTSRRDSAKKVCITFPSVASGCDLTDPGIAGCDRDIGLQQGKDCCS